MRSLGNTAPRGAAKSWVAVVVSIAVHLALLFSLPHVRFHSSSAPLEIAAWDEESELEVAAQDKLKTGQVVKTERGGIKKAPSDSAYLSDQDQTVEKKMRAKSGVAASPLHPRRSHAESLSMKDLGFLKGDLEISKKSSIFESARPLEGVNGLESMTEEYLPDAELGAHTLLSTHEYAHWTYLQRIRKQLAPWWRGDIHTKVNSLFLSGRKLTREQYITRVEVLLDKRGDLLEITVKSASGLPLLDAAATGAFRSASPFPNPPKRLIGPDGTLLLGWSFVVKNSATEVTISRPEEKARRKTL